VVKGEILYNNEEGLAISYWLAGKSPDTSNQNGAIVCQYKTIMSKGYNHFYYGVPPTGERPEKYERIVHAEMDACLSLAACSIPVDHHTKMFCAWATCKQCAIAILGAGIPKLIIHYERCRTFVETRRDEEDLENWQIAMDESAQWLRDGGCEIEVYKGSVDTDSTININGRLWSPRTLEFI